MILSNLIKTYIKHQHIPDADLANALTGICNDVHSNCTSQCPIFYLVESVNGERGECDCFGDGEKMLAVLKKRWQKPDNVMTPDHPKWDEFCARLEGPNGCNFRSEEGKDVWNCAGGNNRDYAKAILKNMKMNVKKSFEYFDNHGGYCDCEILFNVNP